VPVNLALLAPAQSAQISTSVFKALPCVDPRHSVEIRLDPTSALAKSAFT
jgi:hypothetical protein